MNGQQPQIKVLKGTHMKKKKYTKPFTSKIIFDYAEIVSASGEDIPGETDPVGPIGPIGPIGPVRPSFSINALDDGGVEDWSSDSGTDSLFGSDDISEE